MRIKSNTLVLGIVATVCAVMATVGLYLEERERHHRLSLESQIGKLIERQQVLEEDLGAAREDLRQVEANFIATQEENRRLSTQLTEARSSTAELEASITERDDTIAMLKQEMDQLQQGREELTKQAKRLEAKAHELHERIAQLQQEKSHVARPLDGASSAVDLEKVVIGPHGEAPPTGGEVLPMPTRQTTMRGTLLSGRILVVNHEYDFVVMNMGKANGVRLGDEFEVIRGSQMLGRVKVEKLYEALAAAAILPETASDQLQEGDTVRTVMSGS